MKFAKPISFLFLGACAAAVLLAGGCGKPSVSVMQATTTSRPLVIEEDVKLDALHSFPVIPSVSGNITTDIPDVGTVVKKGQVLFTVDSSHYQSELAELQQRVAAGAAAAVPVSAGAPQTGGGADMSEENGLLASGTITQAEYNRILARKSAALQPPQQTPQPVPQAGSAASSGDAAALQATQKAIMDCVVHAPIDGVISQSYVGNQKVALAGKPALVIRQDNPVVAELTIPSRLASAIMTAKKQKTLTVSLSDGSDVVYGEFIQQPQDTDESLSVCHVQFDNTKGKLAIGQKYTLHIDTKQNVPCYLIPKSAFVKPDTVAIVTADNLTDFRTVSTVSTSGGMEMVIDGLSEGDRVIIQPPKNLEIGMQVNVT